MEENYLDHSTRLADQFSVVLNDAEQYSLWPLGGLQLPTGWHECQPVVQGNREFCLKYIETIWHDIRPKSTK